MKTSAKIAAGWLLVLGLIFSITSTSQLLHKPNPQTTTSTSNTTAEDDDTDWANTTTTDVIEKNIIIEKVLLGIPSLFIGGWLLLGLYGQTEETEKTLQQKNSDRLQSIFYQMLKDNYGRITVLAFAIHSDLPEFIAREYLDNRAKEFNATFKVTDDGSVSYHFYM
jgi:hypothetical protein